MIDYYGKTEKAEFEYIQKDPQDMPDLEWLLVIDWNRWKRVWDYKMESKSKLRAALRGFFGFGKGTANRGQFFIKMLLWYTMCTSLIYLCFGIIVTASVQRNYKEQIAQLNEKAIAQSISTCTTTLRDLYNYYYLNVLDSAELTELLLANGYSADLSMRFNKLNARLVNYSDLVESSYVINLVGGFACSTMDTYRNLEEFPDQDILEQLELLQDIPRDYVLIPRKVFYRVQGNSYTRKYISFIFKKYKEGYFVINLDYNAFANMVNYRNYDVSSRALLVNELGIVMADSSEILFGEDVSNESFMSLLTEKEEMEGEFKVSLPEGKKSVHYCKNQLFGISYLILTNESLVGGNTLLLRIVLYAIIAMAANLGLILLGTCFLYGPIGRLLNFLEAEDQITGYEVDEFQVMKNVFNGMRNISKKYSKSRRMRILKELLEDKGVGADPSDRELEQLREELDSTFFVCVNLYPNMEEEYETSENMQLMLFSMENILRELLGKEAHLECVDYKTYLVCLINLDLPHAQSLEEDSEKVVNLTDTMAVTRALVGMQEKMNEYFHVDVSCSIGTMVSALDDISESYEAALTAAFFQMTKEKCALLRYSERERIRSEKQEYPAELSKEILDAIKNGDKGKIRNRISEFFGQMMQYHYRQAVKCLQLLELEITRLEMRYGIYKEGIGYFTEGDSGKRLYKLQEEFLGRSLGDADLCKEKLENNPKMKQIVEQVQALVKENLTQKDLSVTFLAQKLYLSTNYVRTIFKEVTGETLSSYIISKRLEKICELLQQTDWSGQQIADYMGFTSKSYFYTFFKNYMGVTPNSYRKGGGTGEWKVPDVEVGEKESD